MGSASGPSGSTAAALFGVTGKLTSSGGWLNGNIYGNFFPLIMLLTIGYGAAALVGQDEDGTLALVAVLPVRRRTILFQKVWAMALQALISAAARTRSPSTADAAAIPTARPVPPPAQVPAVSVSPPSAGRSSGASGPLRSLTSTRTSPSPVLTATVTVSSGLREHGLVLMALAEPAGPGGGTGRRAGCGCSYRDGTGRFLLAWSDAVPREQVPEVRERQAGDRPDAGV